MDTRISRRALIASLGAIGLVAAVPEPVKRYWFGHTFEPEPGPWQFAMQGPEHLGVFGWRAAAWRDRPDLPPFVWDGMLVPRREQYATPIVFEPAIWEAGRPRLSARDEAIRILHREMRKSDKPIIL